MLTLPEEALSVLFSHLVLRVDFWLVSKQWTRCMEKYCGETMLRLIKGEPVFSFLPFKKLEDLRNRMQTLATIDAKVQLYALVKEIGTPQPAPPVELFRAFPIYDAIRGYRITHYRPSHSQSMSDCYLVQFESDRFTLFSWPQYSHLVTHCDGLVVDSATSAWKVLQVGRNDPYVTSAYNIRPHCDAPFVFATEERIASSILPMNPGECTATFVYWPEEKEKLLSVLTRAWEVEQVYRHAFAIIVDYIKLLVEKK
jgi:hypothetical protein